MSERLRTSEDTERLIDRVVTGLAAEHVKDRAYKWRVMRLALAISLRLPVDPKASPKDLRPKSLKEGSEYRLQQVTGQGKSGGRDAAEADITDPLRAMLGLLHGLDLFGPEHRGDDFCYLLEFHIDRGLNTLKRRWDQDQDLYGALVHLLAPPNEELVKGLVQVEADRVVSGFLELGVVVQKRGNPVLGPRLTHLSLYVPDARDYDRILGGLNKLAFILGLPADSLAVLRNDTQGMPGEGAKTLTLQLPRPRETWTSPGYAQLRQALAQDSEERRLPIVLGVDTYGNTVLRDLTRAPHLLIGGSTGSGKSVALHGLLCGLLSLSPRGVRLHLCDAKGTELVAYRGAPQLVGEVASSAEQIYERIRHLVETMEQRFALLQGRYRDIAEAQQAGQDLPYELLIVDELTDLLMQLPKAEDDLVRLAQKGRAAGIHLILATQRPDARTLTGNLRTNIPARIALAVQRGTESQIILDQKGAEALMPPGDMWISWPGVGLQRAHAFDIRPDDVDHAVRTARGP